jgi:hypothetical protein
MHLDVPGKDVWHAGDVVPPGIYLRVDDDSFRTVILEHEGRLPASYDGHVAHYCRAAARVPRERAASGS